MLARHPWPCVSASWAIFCMVLAVSVVAAAAHETSAPSVESIRQLIAESRYADAEKSARELLLDTESTFGPSSVQTAELLRLVSQSMRRGGKATSAETLDAAQRSVAIMEERSGTYEVELAESLSELGEVYRARGMFRDARPVLEQALSLLENTLGPEDVRTAEAQLAMGTLLTSLGDNEAAELLLSEALRVFELTSGADSPSSAAALSGLASLMWDRGDLSASEALYLKSLAMLERELGPEHERVGGCLASVGLLHHSMGEFERSRDELVRALEILQSTLGPDHPRLVSVLGNLWLAEGALGIPSDRLAEAIALGDRVLGPQHPFTAVYRANLAVALGATDPAEALQLWKQALPVFESSYGPASTRVYWVLDGIGACLLRLGDREAAGRYLERAVAGLEQGSDRPTGMYSEFLRDLADHRFATGKIAEARELRTRALAIDEATLGPSHPSMAGAYRDYGSQLMRDGDLEGASAAFQRALTISEEVFGPEHHDTGWSLFKLAELESEAGRFEVAGRLFARSLELLSRNWRDGQTKNPEDADVERKYAVALLRSGDDTGALAAAERAETIKRTFLQSTVASLPERQALSIAATTPGGLDVEVSAALGADKPQAAEIAFDALIRSRALVLDEMAQRYRTAWLAQDEGMRQLVNAYVAASARLANLTVRGSDERFPERSLERFRVARAEKEAAEQALAGQSEAFRMAEVRGQAGLREIAAALPASGALVSFVRYPRHVPGSEAPDSYLPVDSYAAFVLRSQSQTPVLLDLGTARETDDLIAILRERIEQALTSPFGASAQSEAAYRRAGEALRRRVWDPVEPHLEGATSALLVPDGALGLVDFAALPVGESSYLIETGPRLHYLSAERDLVPAEAGHGAGVLAVGDPSFDDGILFAALRGPDVGLEDAPAKLASAGTYRGHASSCGDFKSLHFSPLPSSALEVREVVSAWEGNLGGSERRLRGREPAIRAQVLEGTAANEMAVKLDSPGRAILHLATHGFFLGEGCPSVLDPLSGASEGPAPRAILGENPLLLSGLALAGANHRGSAGPDEDDGILTAEEIAAMNLSGVQWAVLSACDTGLGQIRAGEGVLGLRRAFQIAGADTVIMSLWPVEDEASREWMRALYENRLSSKMSTVDAVHAANLEQLRRRRAAGLSTHPIFWSGFVAAGDWR